MVLEKLERLKGNLLQMDSVVIAYSGGVDSSFLLSVAVDVLGDRALAVTATSPTFPDSEARDAAELAASLGARHETFYTDQLAIEGFVVNDGRRCYFCRLDLFTRLDILARERGIQWVLDGTNADDLRDTRPGLRAKKEQRVRSPLLEVGLTKAEIRESARLLGLPTWDKPQEACLASRLPIGTPVTFELLDRIQKGEAYLHDLGLRQVRVRHHGATARIEVESGDLSWLMDEVTRAGIVANLKSLGYTYVTLDLAGYRSGSMNVPQARIEVTASSE